MVGTFIGSLIATIYLMLFPFSLLGLIVTVFLLEITCMLLKIPDNGKMATIALIVIMLISQKVLIFPNRERNLAVPGDCRRGGYRYCNRMADAIEGKREDCSLRLFLRHWRVKTGSLIIFRFLMLSVILFVMFRGIAVVGKGRHYYISFYPLAIFPCGKTPGTRPHNPPSKPATCWW